MNSVNSESSSNVEPSSLSSDKSVPEHLVASSSDIQCGATVDASEDGNLDTKLSTSPLYFSDEDFGDFSWQLSPDPSDDDDELEGPPSPIFKTGKYLIDIEEDDSDCVEIEVDVPRVKPSADSHHKGDDQLAQGNSGISCSGDLVVPETELRNTDASCSTAVEGGVPSDHSDEGLKPKRVLKIVIKRISQDSYTVVHPIRDLPKLNPVKLDPLKHRSSPKQLVATKKHTVSLVPVGQQQPKSTRPYQCEYCSYAARSKWALGRHINTHLGIKPYHCEICKKCWTHSENLKRHEKLHQNQGHSRCQSCDRAFSSDRSLTKHLRICSKIQNGQWSHMKDERNQIKHAIRSYKDQIYNYEVRYKCDSCDKRFVFPCDLKRHSCTCSSHISPQSDTAS